MSARKLRREDWQRTTISAASRNCKETVVTRQNGVLMKKKVGAPQAREAMAQLLQARCAREPKL